METPKTRFHCAWVVALLATVGCKGGNTSTSSGTGGGATTGASVGSGATTSTNSTGTMSATGSSMTTTSSTGSGTGPCAIPAAAGTVYYVDQGAANASDTNPGTAAKPWKTIQNAGNVVTAGDVIVVKAGTYDGPIFCWDPPLNGPYSTIAGTAQKRIVFMADPAAAPGSVIVNSASPKTPVAFDLQPGCDYVDIVGFTIKNDGTVKKAGIEVAGSTGNRVLDNTVDGVGGVGGILIDTSTDVLVQGNTVINVQGTGTTGHGMYLSGSSVGVQILGNLIHDNAYVGIHVNGDVSEGTPGVVTKALIAENLIYKNGQNGINADGLESSVIENNVIYDNQRNGIELYQIDALGGSTNNVIVANSIDQSNHGYAIEISACAYDNQSSAPTPASCQSAPFDSSKGNVAFDDILIGASGADNVVSSSDLSLSTNLTSGTPSPFVNAAGGDYSLAVGGPGLGMGIASFGGANAPMDAGKYDIGASSFGLHPLCP